ncbi:MAG: LysM peptidoglycan-binding domain-containing protein [Sphingomonadales bacterium]|nr:LysM peptidoglycan-binding domain-containing protein [Sphingomonadales bacterium]
MQLSNRYICTLLTSLFSILNLSAQAPIGPAMETNMDKIDSMTQLLYENIPSHIPVTDTFNHNLLNQDVFKSQMNQLGSTIAFPYNQHVALHIRYLMAQNDAFYDMLHKRMQLYFPIYEQVLDRYNLPQELKYVSIIESHLNPNAVSWCGATGLWQFMPYTGRSMGMRIDYTIDERKGIVQSTEKACEYFKNSYNIFGDWLMAIASYNCGPGNVQRAINRSGGKKDFWSIMPFLPKETQNYVPKFIAAAYVLSFTRYSTYNHNYRSAVLVKTPVDSAIGMGAIARYLSISEDDIIGYNREFIKKSTPGKQTHYLLLPYDVSMQFMAEKDSIYAFARREKAVEDANKPAYVQKWVPSYHKVTRGQTLYSIARRYGVTVKQIKAWNGLKSSTAPLGRTLIIYKMQWVNNRQG